MRGVFLQRSGLVCALGADLPAALACLEAGGVTPARLGTPPQAWPCFTIADASAAAPDWYARARRLIRAAVAQCGEVDRRAPLFLASCSLDVGAFEDATTGPGATHDCLVLADAVRAWLDWQGPVHWVSTACTSSHNALLAAADGIRAGAFTHALVLGVELHNRFSSAGFGALQLLDVRRPRPLAADRAGLVLGEAVAALWLGDASARWRLAGGANVVSGADPAGASAAAVAAMCRLALAQAGLTPADIGLIKLQAAGSPANDATELAGLRAVFATLPALTTLKAEIGHTLGASGAAELALLCACLESGVWPRPRAAAEPALDAAFASRPPEAPARRYLLANILGFGGGHSTLVVEDCA
ncbi:MAG: beta-ketoacyl synthase N-terminal-like domain-containing protein [Candidatus Dactylopiibacterium sp.]|nr:beta-ketoacyl synthase N-terminal-like domain-containing protein [Candidatus Dactylopiibacterium sp.]